jgi:hypothetical protein
VVNVGATLVRAKQVKVVKVVPLKLGVPGGMLVGGVVRVVVVRGEWTLKLGVPGGLVGGWESGGVGALVAAASPVLAR